VSRYARFLKSSGRGHAGQRKAFAQLMGQIARTEFGVNHGLTPDTTYEQFRENVPPRTYDYYKPLVGRMAAGEPNVLVPGVCPFFVVTSGTTGTEPKLLPVPEAMLAHYRRGLRDTLYLYSLRTGHAGVFLGRHVHMGASTALIEANGLYCASFDGILALSLSPWVEANLYAPPSAIAEMPESSDKVFAAARAMMHRDVTLVAGTPADVASLALAVREAASTGKRRMTHLQTVWPNLECFLFTGSTLGLFAEHLRSSLGPTVNFQEMYAAAEGIFAAQCENINQGLRLLADNGVLFEFLPYQGYSEANLEKVGAQCLPLEKVQINTEYVLLVTTPAGLCRYVPGDIVRFLSLDPPRMQFAGRVGLELNAFGEHVTETELVDTIQTVCARNGWQAVSFHVAPYHHRLAAGQTINSHEWWVELRTHTTRTPTANLLGPELDAELAHRNPTYAAKRACHGLDFPTVRLVVPGVFDQWAQGQNKAASTSKMARCRSDRLIADQLAELARYHPATAAIFSPENLHAPA